MNISDDKTNLMKYNHDNSPHGLVEGNRDHSGGSTYHGPSEQVLCRTIFAKQNDPSHFESERSNVYRGGTQTNARNEPTLTSHA